MNGLLIVNAFLKNGKFGALYDLLADAARRMEIGLAVQTNAEVVSALCRDVFQSEDYDFCLFWDKDVQLAAQLEGLGMRLFNSSDAIAACDDKALTFLRLKPLDVPMPETVIAPKTFSNVGYTDLNFAREIGAQMRYPLIVKECFGSFGMQVYWCRDEAELLERIGKLGGERGGGQSRGGHAAPQSKRRLPQQPDYWRHDGTPRADPRGRNAGRPGHAGAGAGFCRCRSPFRQGRPGAVRGQFQRPFCHDFAMHGREYGGGDSAAHP